MLATNSSTSYHFEFTPDPALSAQDRLTAFQTHFRAQPAPADFSDPAFIAVLRTYARLLREARTRTLHEYVVTIPSDKRRACARHWAERFETCAAREHTREQREQKDRDQEDLRINRHRRAAARAQDRHRISELSLAALQARLAKMEQRIQDTLAASHAPTDKRPSSTTPLPDHSMDERKLTETQSALASSSALNAVRDAAQSNSRTQASTSIPALGASPPPRQKSPDDSAPSVPCGSREIASDHRIDKVPGALHPDPTRLRNPDP